MDTPIFILLPKEVRGRHLYVAFQVGKTKREEKEGLLLSYVLKYIEAHKKEGLFFLAREKHCAHASMTLFHTKIALKFTLHGALCCLIKTSEGRKLQSIRALLQAVAHNKTLQILSRK